MQLEALKVFCDVARNRSFSQAAAVNHVSQSAVSQVVSQLERRLEARLIDRSFRPLQLTALGQAYYDGCKGLIEQYAELEASIRKAQHQLAANVQVAAIYSVGLGDMGQFVERFRIQHADAQIHVEYLHPDRVYERVLDGTCDFGLVSFPRKTRDLIVHPWREEEMMLVCSPQHRLASRYGIQLQELEGERYVGFDRDLIIRRKVDQFLREHGVSVKATLEFDNIENIKKAIEISGGVALLPGPTLSREVRAGTLVAVPLDGCRFVRPLGIIQRRHHPMSSTALGFMSLLRQAGNANGRLAPGRNGAGARARGRRKKR
jgi:DNA-binding transcriptional LysR family regulator